MMNKKRVHFTIVIFFVSIFLYFSTTKVLSDSSIIINGETNQPYTIPQDAMTKYEDAMETKYYQGDSIKKNFQKIKINGISTRLWDWGNYVIPLDSEDAFLASITHHNYGSPETNLGSGKFASSQIIKVNRNGNIVDSLWPATGRRQESTEGNSFDNGVQHEFLSEFFKFNGRISYFGFGQTPFDKNNNLYLVSLDENLKNVRYDKLSLSKDQGISFIGTYLIQEKEIIATGYTNTGKQKPGQPIQIRAFFMDKATAQINKTIDFNFPPYEFFVTFPKDPSWFISVKNVIETFDGRYILQVEFGNWNYTNVQYALLTFDTNGNYVSQHGAKNEFPAGQIMYLMDDINDNLTIHYYSSLHTKNSGALFKYDIASNKASILNNRFPPYSNISIHKGAVESNHNRYEFFGYASKASDDFAGYGNTGGAVLGTMDNHFRVTNASIINSKATLDFKQMKPFGSLLAVSGLTAEGTSNTNSKDTFVAPPEIGWQNKDNSNFHNAFSGVMKKIDDYAPGIHFTKENLVINMNNPQNDWDNLLLSGIEVTDTFDLDKNGGNYTQDWLNKRMNKNPLNMNFPIDWQALGLNKNNRGPQKIKYFITDSSLQTTAASRWLNMIDDETTYTKEGALSASNFSIHVKDMHQLTNVSAKQLAELLAWDLNNGHIKDNGTVEKNVVHVNEKQLKQIKDVQATYKQQMTAKEKAALIKPYPLTFTFDYAGKKIERTITVFISDDTTEIDEENHVVIYGFDFKESIKQVKDITEKQVIDLAQVSVWHFNMNFGDAEVPKKEVAVNLKDSVQPNNPSLTGLNNVTTKGQYKVKFSYKKARNHKVTAHIYDNLITIHIRQIILHSSDKVVIPTSGYSIIHNISNPLAPHADSAQTSNLQYLSTIVSSGEKYTKFSLQPTFDYWFYNIVPIIPQYYEYAGFIVSDNPKAPHSSHLAPGNISLDLKEEKDYWVTIYLTPSSENVKPFNWDYQINSFSQ